MEYGVRDYSEGIHIRLSVFICMVWSEREGHDKNIVFMPRDMIRELVSVRYAFAFDQAGKSYGRQAQLGIGELLSAELGLRKNSHHAQGIILVHHLRIYEGLSAHSSSSLLWLSIAPLQNVSK